MRSKALIAGGLLAAMVTAVRLYGTGVEFFDQSWKPDDLLKVK